MSLLIRTIDRSLSRFPNKFTSIHPKKPLGLSTGKLPYKSKFALEFAEHQSHAGKTYKYWKYATIFLCTPILTYLTYKEGKEFLNEEHEQREFIPYSHMRIRNKPFPWGNNSLFHHPMLNPGPEGEAEIERQTTIQLLQSYYDKLQQYLYEHYERREAMKLALVEGILEQAGKDLQKHKRILVLHENPLYQKQRPFVPSKFAYDWSHTYPVRQDQTPDGY
ncbi:hypothetical protein LOD99_8685 [Oopsacas minuta]|uniref:Uncharacterized protein n=1 Tax=Oopsacas minuta TaxID=111878 RepID=A0AAV7JFP2_9METZ|nr:hypothetical protein LOD99_8685 [Oopsacas minuta]